MSSEEDKPETKLDFRSANKVTCPTKIEEHVNNQQKPDKLDTVSKIELPDN